MEFLSQLPHIDMNYTNMSLIAVAGHFLSAALATGHAIINKVNPRSAIGWVGLFWLSPFIGVLAYYIFGINRIRRKGAKLGIDRLTALAREQEHCFTPQDFAGRPEIANLKDLAQLGKSLSGRELLDGNSITPLQNGDQAYPEMLRAIGEAQTSVCLTSFIFRHDTIGRQFVEALAAAKERGVDVRVIIDGVGGGYLWSRTAFALRRRKIPTQRFMHSFVPWRMPYLNMRSHKKILVIDGITGFVGGMNIADENVHEGKKKHVINDIHFRVDGTVVMHLAAAFAEDWLFLTGKQIKRNRCFPAITRQGHSVARGIASGPDEDNEKLQWIMSGAIGTAKNHIQIMTPYFLPDQRVLAALSLAALRGVHVEILVPGKSNHRYIDHAAWAQYEQLLKPGCRIIHSPAPFDHSKLMTVDGSWALLGSTNWDARSMRLNFEFNIEIYDHRLVGTIVSFIDEKIKASREITLADVQNRSTLRKLHDGGLRLLQPYL